MKLDASPTARVSKRRARLNLHLPSPARLDVVLGVRSPKETLGVTAKLVRSSARFEGLRGLFYCRRGSVSCRDADGGAGAGAGAGSGESDRMKQVLAVTVGLVVMISSAYQCLFFPFLFSPHPFSLLVDEVI